MVFYGERPMLYQVGLPLFDNVGMCNYHGDELLCVGASNLRHNKVLYRHASGGDFHQ